MIDSTSGRTPAPPRSILIVASIVVGIALLLSRPMNFTPLGAFGLFVGTYAHGGRTWVYPTVALAIFVIATGGYEWLVMLSVLLGFVGPVVIGSRWLKGRVSVTRVGTSALASSGWFFLVSNLGSWVVFGLPRGEGLAHHYLLGVPFFWNTLAGDLSFCAVLFGGYAAARVASRHAAFTSQLG